MLCKQLLHWVVWGNEGKEKMSVRAQDRGFGVVVVSCIFNMCLVEMQGPKAVVNKG